MTRADLIAALAATLAGLRRDETTLRRGGTAAAIGAADYAAEGARCCDFAGVGMTLGLPSAEERARAVLGRWGSPELRERLAGRAAPERRAA